MDFQKILELLLNTSKPTLLTLLGIFFLTIAILGKFKDWIDLKTKNERLVAGILGTFFIIVGISPGPFQMPPISQPSESPSATVSTEIRISGSSSMAQDIDRHKKGFESKYSSASVKYTLKGSELGILDLYNDDADIAAI